MLDGLVGPHMVGTVRFQVSDVFCHRLTDLVQKQQQGAFETALIKRMNGQTSE